METDMATTDPHALADHLLQVLHRASVATLSYSVEGPAEITIQVGSDATAREGAAQLKRAGYRCKRRHYPGAAPEIVVTLR
jgi:hypothetical protein